MTREVRLGDLVNVHEERVELDLHARCLVGAAVGIAHQERTGRNQDHAVAAPAPAGTDGLRRSGRRRARARSGGRVAPAAAEPRADQGDEHTSQGGLTECGAELHGLGFSLTNTKLGCLFDLPSVVSGTNLLRWEASAMQTFHPGTRPRGTRAAIP